MHDQFGTCGSTPPRIAVHPTASHLVILLLVVLAATVGCQKPDERGSKLPPLEGPGAPPQVVIPKIAQDNPVANAQATDRLIVTGNAAPLKEAKIGAKATGTLVAMLVEEGDKVTKGQTLFRLDGTNQVLAINQVLAALNAATVGMTTAETDLARTKALFDSGSVAPAVYDSMKARYDGAKAAVEQAKAALAQTKQSRVDTTVRSPISGVVSKRLSSVGEMVTMMPPTVVLIVQDNSQLEVRGRVPETLLKRIRPGSEIDVRFPAVDVTRRVSIERINPSVDPYTRTVEVVALVPNKDAFLRPGMLIELDFGITQNTRSEQ